MDCQWQNENALSNIIHDTSMKKLTTFIIRSVMAFCAYYQCSAADTVLTVGKHNIFVIDTGKGHPLIALHGGPGDNSANFTPQLLSLSATNRLILYDQSGAGKSTSAALIQSSMTNEVQVLHDLLQRLGIQKANLLGHSWGSILAMQFAATYPEMVNKIVLTASIGTKASYYTTFAQRLQSKFTPLDIAAMQILQRQGVTNPQEYLNIYIKYYFHDTLNIKKMTPTTINFTVNQQIIADMMKNYDVTKNKHTIRCPILILQGKADLLTVKDMHEAFAGFPNVEIQEMSASGHWAFVEEEQLFTQYVGEFLQKKEIKK